MQRLEDDRLSAGHDDLKSDFSMPDQEELICRIALVEEELPSIETMIFRAPSQKLAMLLWESRKKWMLTQNTLKSLHYSPPFRLRGLS
jgi:hypothetical protein